MPRSRILFTVPADAGRISDVLGEAGATVDDREGMDHDEIAAHLASVPGETVEAIVEDDDPLTPIHDVAGLLDGTGCAYFGVVDAFQERSRGMRVLGRLLLDPDGSGNRIEKPIPWEHGEPNLDARTLEAVGMERAEAKRVDEVFRARLDAPPRTATPRP